MIEGFATSSQTASRAKQHPDLTYGPLGRTGLQVSQAGFGCYRIFPEVAEHATALGDALKAGVNLIDTSANYADGGSEELVGNILAQQIASGWLRREQVVIVSKAGYLQGRNYELSQQRKRRGDPFPDLVPYADGLEHCIHPDFLEDQLTRSLQRLGMETLDIYLLHNPEYFLGWAHQQGRSADRAQALYLQRIEKAFRHLETEVTRGRIRWYGISSNTFPVEPNNPQFTCLELVWQAAEAVSVQHHFGVIQLPMNLFESGAVLSANQPSGMTTLACARQKDLAVLVNRPLNALAGNRLLRLADMDCPPRLSDDEAQRRMATLQKNEEVFTRQVLPELDLDPAMHSRLVNHLISTEALKSFWNSLQGYEHWRQIRQQYLMPRVEGVMAYLDNHQGAGRQTTGWQSSYRNALEAVLLAFEGHYGQKARQQAQRVKSLLAKADAQWADNVSLSRLAIRSLRSTLGVACVLVGMRKKEYVEEVIDELRIPISAIDREHSWAALRKSLSTAL